MDTIRVYNNTDEFIELGWNLVQYQLPHGGAYALIVGPNQYAPFAMGGQAPLPARDTMEIIFYLWPTNLNPGDTAYFQIHVFDPLDTMAAGQILTSIEYCPLSTNAETLSPNKEILCYPNPVQSSATIKIPDHDFATSLSLYDENGIAIKQLPVSSNEISFSRDGLPGGIYFLRLMKNETVISFQKLILMQ